MKHRERTEKSKFLSYVLRHRPDAVGITLDTNGWVSVEDLLTACAKIGKDISKAALEEIVRTSPKRRFALSDDGTRVRANQGHSVTVDLGLSPQTPPQVLYHGTVDKSLASILSEGLKKMSRHHVHLSCDRTTATAVGGRRGTPVILEIDAGRMHRDGYVFYKSENNVWLTDEVPAEYISR